MFDEIEDVFNNDDNPFSSRQKNKAWINRILENNTIPTFWITNNVRSIDSAIVRRFDMAIEVPIPKKQKREEILRQSSNNVINNETIAKLAEVETIAPALVSRAIKVISSLDTKDTKIKMTWHEPPGSVYEIGVDFGDHFAYGNEAPRHKQYIRIFNIASRLVANGE